MGVLDIHCAVSMGQSHLTRDTGTGMVHACVSQKVTHINFIVRQNQPLKVKKSSQKAQMT
jgi:hypothetical protein